MLNQLRAMGVKVFRTDEQGTIVATDTSDGSAEQGDYILNANTKKFHRPTCASVKRMSETNKVVSTQSREALIEQGYEPCKNCNP